ncbi:MAG: chromosome segregation protein SMC [Rhodothermales bacterium]
MYLSKLELHGFKSFAERTVVDFAPGVTCVVGPNGCGKSNVVDAVRWVIGEQRARILRSDKMDNVIFNGTSKRRSLGMAEVMLTIENTRGILPIEYSEVTIGRRLFRSGESEYLLNGVQCRLKDITDLFMDTGMGAGAYSVIELKMIEELLSDNTQDRRHLFEEAAGITKYKVRRGQTLRKLKSTQVDLDRVRDLTDELDKRVASLERQARKATKHKEYESRLHFLELSLAGLEYDELTGQQTTLSAERTSFAEQAAGLSAKVSAEEATHEALRADHVTREKAVSEAQTLLSDHTDKLRAAESDLRISTERLSTISRDMTRLAEEETTDAAQRDMLLRLKTRAEQDISDAQPAADVAEKSLTDARRIRDEAQNTQQRHQVKLHNLRLEERTVTTRRVEQQRQLDRLSSRLEVITAEMDERRTALEGLGAGDGDLETRLGEVRSRVDAAVTARKSAEKALNEALSSRSERNDALEGAREALRGAERALDAAGAEVALLEGLLGSFEDFGESVQFLAEESSWTSREMLTVADVVSCDDAVRPAVDAALGAWAGCIVVETDAEARAAVRALRSSEKGRVTFLVLERLARVEPSATQAASNVGSAVSSGSEASVSPLRAHVRTTSDRWAPLLDLLFHDAWLVEGDLDSVTADGSGRFFTASGEWADARGAWHAGGPAGGSSAAASRLGRREQLEVARRTRDACAERAEEARGAVDTARTALEALDIDALRRSLDERRATQVEAEKELARLDYEQETVVRRRQEIQTRLATLEDQRTATESELQSVTADLKKLTVQVAELQQKRGDAEAAFQDIEEASREAFGLFNEANITAVQTRNRLDNLRRDLARTTNDLENLDKRATDRQSTLATLTDQKATTEKRCATLSEQIRDLQEARGALDEAVSQARNRLMDTRVEISDLEVRLRDLRREKETAVKEESRREVRLAEIATRLEDLIRSVSEDFEVDLTAYEVDVDEDFNRAEAKREVHDLRNRIRQMGPVNALALESFEEEKERLTFLREQLDDLEKAESTLMTTITEINTTASRRFNETFGAIQENFRRLFADLFGEGAAADVVLQDESDPLESEIEIFAKPRGKKPSVLAQLSGGEKTLTAIALLFSIYLVKPSPFCILDEVDAPLDDANVDRFMQLIRTFSDSTQFVLVTHNKRTMEAADRMYGITMQEQGVSKLVGVKFEDGLQLVA